MILIKPYKQMPFIKDSYICLDFHGDFVFFKQGKAFYYSKCVLFEDFYSSLYYSHRDLIVLEK